jgi:hypothetical protein
MKFVVVGLATGLAMTALIAVLRVMVEGFEVAEVLRDLGVGAGAGMSIGLVWGFWRRIGRRI